MSETMMGIVLDGVKIVNKHLSRLQAHFHFRTLVQNE